MLNKKKLLSLLLTAVLVLPLFPAFTVEASNSVNVVVNFYRESGIYQNNDVWVGNFGAAPANVNQAWTMNGDWRQTTFSLNNVQNGDYIAFQLMNDSIWQNDLRYIDPWGDDFGSVGTMPATIEIWLVDGDLRAFSEPQRVDEKFVTARDGIRYMAIQGIFYTLNPGISSGPAPRGRDVFTFFIPAAATVPVTGNNNGRWLDQDGNRAFDALRPAGQQAIPYNVITINRDGVRTLANAYGQVTGTAGGQGDWFEIAPELGTMMVNFTGNAGYQSEFTVGPYAMVNNSVRNLAFGEVNPNFAPIDAFYENTSPRDGYTFMSLGSLERIMGTVVPRAFGADVYLMPTLFVAYDTVTDISNNPALQEAAGFTTYGLQRVDDWIMMNSTAFDGMPAGMSITRHGKMVFNSVHGDALSRDPGVARGRPLPHSQRVPATTDTLFDLASNSKMYGAIFAIQALVSDGSLNLDQVLNTVPGWENMTDAHWQAWAGSTDRRPGSFGGWNWTGTGRDAMTIRQVLNHVSRFAPDPEYMDPQRAGDLFFQWDHSVSRAQNLQDFIDVLVLTPLAATGEGTVAQQPSGNVGGIPIYSDVNFLIAAVLVEQISGQPLDIFMHNIYADMGLTHTRFNPLRHGFTVNDAAATEMVGNTRDGFRSFGYLDDGITPAFMREHALRGEVHDEKSYYLLDGAGGSAGLFSTTGDMASLMQLAQNAGVYNRSRIFSRETHDYFRTPVVTSWGIGWRISNRDNNSMANFQGGPSHFGSYGHQGWTGTQSVIDPVNGIALTILTSSFGPNFNIGTPAAHNNFVPRFGPVYASGNFSGPASWVTQNIFAYAALRTYDNNIREWTVNFNLNGGSGVPASMTIRDGNFIPNLTPVRGSDEFEGWFTDSALTEPWDPAADRVMSNMTLYADWGTAGLPAGDHRVVFVAGNDVVAVQEVTGGGTANEIDFPNFAHDRGARVARPGFRFDGWYANSGFTTPFNFGGAINVDTTVYARMTPVFTVTFNTVGGSFIWPQFVEAGGAATLPPINPSIFSGIAVWLAGQANDPSNPPSRRFDGWFTAGGAPFNFSASINADTTVYAHWTPRWYVLPVYVGAGTATRFATLHNTVSADMIGRVPAVIPAGYTFEGWYYDLALTMPFNETDLIWTNTTLYPRFVRDIEAASIVIPEPVAGELPVTQLRIASDNQNAVLTPDIVGYLATLQWFNSATNAPVTGAFGSGDYRAVVSLTSVGLSGARTDALGNSSGPMPTTLTPKTMYRWNPALNPSITVNGFAIADADITITGGHVTGNVLRFELDFAAQPVEANPPVITLEADDITLTWPTVTGAADYVIYVDGTTVQTVASPFDLSTLGLAPGAYTIQLRTIGDGNLFLDSQLSNTVSFIVGSPAAAEVWFAIRNFEPTLLIVQDTSLTYRVDVLFDHTQAAITSLSGTDTALVIEWLHDGIVVQTTNLTAAQAIASGGVYEASLLLNNAQVVDSGTYTIRADLAGVATPFDFAQASQLTVRPFSTDASLNNLNVTGRVISPVFNPNILQYTLTVANQVTNITVNATPADSNATLTGTGARTLAVGENIINIVVTAEDGVATRTYTITVTRLAAEQPTPPPPGDDHGDHGDPDDWTPPSGAGTPSQQLPSIPPAQRPPNAPTAAQNEASVNQQLNAGASQVTLTLPEGVTLARLTHATISSLTEAEVPLIINSGLVTVEFPVELLANLAARRADQFNIDIAKTLGTGNLFVTFTINIGSILNNREVNITTFNTPFIISVDLSGFDLTGRNTNRLSAIFGGNNIGGTFIPNPRFEFEVTRTGTYQVAYVPNLVRAALQLGSPTITDLTGNSRAGNMDVVPVIVSDRTLVPVRFIAEDVLGLPTVGWDGSTSTVTLSDGARELSFAIGQLAPGMDVPAQIIDGRTMVPLRFVSEFFGATVNFEQATRVIEIIR